MASRGSFYDQTGAIRDVVQNHLLEIVALLAMEPPVANNANAWRDEKVKVFRAIRALEPKDVVRGQYRGYTAEKGVDPASDTETFVAEQMRQTIGEFRQALAQVEAAQPEQWSAENYPTELTRGLTAVENARMEWNAARLKFPVLEGEASAATEGPRAAGAGSLFEGRSLRELCRLGLALTWPLAAVALLALALMVFLILRP